MKYPKFLKNNAKIGITAPSCGVGDHIDDFEKSINNIRSRTYQILETKSVRTTGYVSSTKEERVEQLNSLIEDKSVDMIMCATGGDFLNEILPLIDLEKIRNNPKWFMGASDPTNLLYLITTSTDIATIYGHNAGSFDAINLYKSQNIALEYLKGNILEQEKYDLYEIDRESRKNGEYNLTEKVIWENINGDVDISGRIIGGCLDCLKYLPGTPYDYTKQFIDRYKEDGIVWYFDIFALTPEDTYLTLLQLKEAKWFENIKGVVAGRVAYPNSYTELKYQDILKKIFPDIPVIFNADIGHVAPKMTIINGSIARIISNEKIGKISFELK